MSNIKVIEKIGKELGKNVVVLVCVHGNESFGCEILDKIVPSLKIDAGKIVFIYANLESIRQNKRFIDFNLNRCFLRDQPEEIRNSLEGKTAGEIMPYLEEADTMLDIHASTIENSVPFVICDPQSFGLAKIMPFKIVSYNWDEFEPGSTDYYMNIQEKIGLGIECGYLGDPESKERGEKALMNFLKKTGAIKGDVVETHNQKFYKIIYLHKNKNGPFKKAKDFSNFEKLKENTIIGHDGEEPIYAQKGDFILFVHNRKDVGEECFLIAREESN